MIYQTNTEVCYQAGKPGLQLTSGSPHLNKFLAID